MAGEDIAQENMIQKSETNIIEVIRDNIDKQKCLKVMKCILLVISICAVSVIGFTIYRLKKPQNYISPVAKDSIEMQTAELLAGPDGAFVYKFITTDEYKKLRLHIYRYESGKLSEDVYKRQTLAYAIAAILWIFAVINQINLTVTNLLSQKQEMGTLKSIGMTNKREVSFPDCNTAALSKGAYRGKTLKMIPRQMCIRDRSLIP